MKQSITTQNEMAQTQRRNFIKKGMMVALAGTAGLYFLSGCKSKDEEEDEGQKVSPPKI